MPGVAREARGFDRGVAGVLATVGGAGIGDDYADFFFREMEGVAEFFTDSEGALRSGPDGDAAIFPFGDCSTRLERDKGYSAMADANCPRSLSTMETRTLSVPKSTPATMAMVLTSRARSI
jgi:hypothetical protein